MSQLFHHGTSNALRFKSIVNLNPSFESFLILLLIVGILYTISVIIFIFLLIDTLIFSFPLLSLSRIISSDPFIIRQLFCIFSILYSLLLLCFSLFSVFDLFYKHLMNGIFIMHHDVVE